jgi:hypothetical protein
MVLVLTLAAGAVRADTLPAGSAARVTGIPSLELELASRPSLLGRQRQSNWCWAATSQVILNYHGVVVSQEELVARLFGTLVDQPAGLVQIIAALDGWRPTVAGTAALITAAPYLFEDLSFLADLDRRWPMIVGLRGASTNVPGHAYVLTAVTHATGPMGQVVPLSYTLIDPWPESPSRIDLTPDQFAARFMFAVRIRVQR